MNRVTLIFSRSLHSLKCNFFHFLELDEKMVSDWKGSETFIFPGTQGTKLDLFSYLSLLFQKILSPSIHMPSILIDKFWMKDFPLLWSWL